MCHLPSPVLILKGEETARAERTREGKEEKTPSGQTHLPPVCLSLLSSRDSSLSAPLAETQMCRAGSKKLKERHSACTCPRAPRSPTGAPLAEGSAAVSVGRTQVFSWVDDERGKEEARGGHPWRGGTPKANGCGVPSSARRGWATDTVGRGQGVTGSRPGRGRSGLEAAGREVEEGGPRESERLQIMEQTEPSRGIRTHTAQEGGSRSLITPGTKGTAEAHVPGTYPRQAPLWMRGEEERKNLDAVLQIGGQ